MDIINISLLTPVRKGVGPCVALLSPLTVWTACGRGQKGDRWCVYCRIWDLNGSVLTLYEEYGCADHCMCQGWKLIAQH